MPQVSRATATPDAIQDRNNTRFLRCPLRESGAADRPRSGSNPREREVGKPSKWNGRKTPEAT